MSKESPALGSRFDRARANFSPTRDGDRRAESATVSPMSAAPFDRRLTPARPDLAADQLRGLVDASRYAIGQLKRVIAASAPLRRYPDAGAPLETEALHGESVTVFDEHAGWAWVQLDRDKYVGYLPGEALAAPSEPTHRVAALRTHAYPGPSIKLPPRMALSLGARLTIVGRGGDFAVSADGLHVWLRHTTATGVHKCCRSPLVFCVFGSCPRSSHQV